MKAGLLLILLSASVAWSQIPDFRHDFPDTLHRARLRKIVRTEAGIYVGGLSYMSLIWYKDTPFRPLHFFNDNREWLQVDKWGHAYTSYHLGERGYYALRWAGVSKPKALLWGGTLGLICLTPVEVLDGVTDEYGFSKPDMLANVAGTALFVVQEALFDEQILKMKFSYHPTDYAQLIPNQMGRTHTQRLFKDYNGQTYWLSANLHKLLGGHNQIPRWLCVSVGYGADGVIAKFVNPYPDYRGTPMPYIERRKQYYLSLDVDLNKIPTRSRFMKKLFQQLNILKVPMPTLEWTAGRGTQFKALYF